MSDSTRTFDHVKRQLLSNRCTDTKERNQFYDSWAENYRKDVAVLGYNGPTLAANCLLTHFAGSREAALVLDVACGTGLVAEAMSELGFRHFVGVDGSKGMLEQAAETGLYQDLRPALLGTQPLPAQADMFDVVMIVGGLRVGIVPVSAVRELCNATKPGGLVCMTRGDFMMGPVYSAYKADLERELQLMEEEGLWTQVEDIKTDKYLKNVYQEGDMADMRDGEYMSASIYLYRKL
ncbi:methyltransferase-like protein 27 [Centroberyx affinis]|uniref:methyltransferase-like protein 27 n=1 Tax=Centroberyx affinis TaxID=166261 RepID=UPI003A5BFF06